jgi:hypothetical protein
MRISALLVSYTIKAYPSEATYRLDARFFDEFSAKIALGDYKSRISGTDIKKCLVPLLGPFSES